MIMEIKTKFGIGDKVWCIYHTKVKSFVIKNIRIHGGFALLRIYYSDKEETITVNESECFATKDELIAYITSDE